MKRLLLLLTLCGCGISQAQIDDYRVTPTPPPSPRPGVMTARLPRNCESDLRDPVINVDGTVDVYCSGFGWYRSTGFVTVAIRRQSR